MNTQLSLFSESLVEDRLVKQAEVLTVTVEAYCLNCRSTSTIGPHIPVHPMKWMKKNWKEIRENVFRVEGLCSRQCEQSYSG